MGAYLDEELLFRTLEIAYRHGISEIIETGTSDGYSTAIMAQCFEKVQTIEIVSDTFNLAKQRLDKFDNIKMHMGNSVDIFKQILIPNNNNYIFFLDAHWEDYCPLEDELKTIKEKNIIAPIIIHDFFVPNFFDGGISARFHYDSYNNQPFTIDWILPNLIDLYGINKFHYYYNVRPTSENVGVLFIEPLLN